MITSSDQVALLNGHDIGDYVEVNGRPLKVEEFTSYEGSWEIIYNSKTGEHVFLRNSNCSAYIAELILPGFDFIAYKGADSDLNYYALTEEDEYSYDDDWEEGEKPSTILTMDYLGEDDVKTEVPIELQTLTMLMC